MNNKKNNIVARSWYREFWAWFTLGIFAIAFLAAIVTVYIVSTNVNHVVSKNWYSEGETINKQLALDEMARLLDVVATVGVSESDDVIEVRLSQNANKKTAGAVSEPDDLTIHILHPTHPNKDQTIELKAIKPGLYRGHLLHSVNGYRRITLSSHKHNWRLVNRAHLSRGQTAHLGAAKE